MKTRTLRVDIDGTVATPRFFHENLKTCANLYVEAGIVHADEVSALQFHQQLFLLPHVLLTHHVIEGAIEALHSLDVEYFTVRQNFDPTLCEQVHKNTHLWLEQQHLPCPMNVRFFWDAGEKLTASLEAQEEEVLLIDDRPSGLVKAYEKLVQSNPQQAQQIKQRLTIVAFGTDTHHFDSDLRVIPLPNWLLFRQRCLTE